MSAIVLRPDAWPEPDRRLWNQAMDLDDDLSGPRPAARLSPFTIRNAARAYGRFLGVLAAGAPLGPEGPAARVTPETVQRFVEALRAAGGSNNTIAQYVHDLRGALRLMLPKADFGWVTSPGGVAIRALLSAEPRQVRVIDPRALLTWALDLIADRKKGPLTIARARTIRNGLIIGILATRAPRQRTITAIRIGRQLHADGAGGFMLEFAEEDIKTHRALSYPLNADLREPMRFWLEQARPLLLRGQTHDSLWVAQDGTPLGQEGLSRLVRRAAEKRFGQAFGTHVFRHCLATFVARSGTDTPGIAAVVLGSGARTVERHYNRAGQFEALRAADEVLRKEREQLRARADLGS
jgi:integrase/recombinase XerD